MKIAIVIIDVDGGKLKIRDQEEEVNFKMSKGIHYLKPKDINVVKEVLFVTSKAEQVSRLLKNCFSYFSPQQMKLEENGPLQRRRRVELFICYTSA